MSSMELQERFFSAGTVMYNVSRQSETDIVLSTSSNKGHYVATCNPSEGLFYQMFAPGCCACSGDIVKQARAYTMEILVALLAMYKTEHEELGDRGESCRSSWTEP